jgi:hypothetical protein
MMPETQKWEYRAQSLGTFWSEPKLEDIETTLNEWGLEGWEVVSAYPVHGSNKITLIARRPLTSATRRQRTWPGD